MLPTFRKFDNVNSLSDLNSMLDYKEPLSVSGCKMRGKGLSRK